MLPMAHLIIAVLVRMKLHGQSVVGFLDCCLYKRNRVRPCHKRMSNGPLAIILVPARLPSRRQAPAAAGTCVLYVCLLGMGKALSQCTKPPRDVQAGAQSEAHLIERPGIPFHHVSAADRLSDSQFSPRALVTHNTCLSGVAAAHAALKGVAARLSVSL